MKKMSGIPTETFTPLKTLCPAALPDRPVTVRGMVHALRKLGGITFLTLRGPERVLQCVFAQDAALRDVTEECAVAVTGVLRAEERAPGGMELAAETLTILSRPAAPLPVPVSKWKLDLNLDTELALRPVVLRNLRQRSVFRVQEALARAFRDTSTQTASPRSTRPRSSTPGRRAAPTSFGWTISAARRFWPSPPSFTSR